MGAHRGGLEFQAGIVHPERVRHPAAISGSALEDDPQAAGSGAGRLREVERQGDLRPGGGVGNTVERVIRRGRPHVGGAGLKVLHRPSGNGGVHDLETHPPGGIGVVLVPEAHGVASW